LTKERDSSDHFLDLAFRKGGGGGGIVAPSLFKKTGLIWHAGRGVKQILYRFDI